ncbi:MAG: NAD(P)H-dependent oxidoreductase [Natronomonas sp.]|jgi:NAD(P)H-dependent FMN reductase|uniref:NADPH-dependent FMN reductase n=1 Tax=Natronomonas sp. TaxID=2184060 RepID=UPI002870391B|nr:NAD(P)H-dependent oxidoreductase [Natronomonas sp.]MDR9429963.1 NAD(P)H-dependent oxidoreductase [Natronomonas sp.]
MTEIRVAALVGSLRDGSYTRPACRHALDEAATYEAVETDLVDLRDVSLPVYDADDDEAGDAAELRARLRDADSIILGSPVYHGSYASALKNALDYCGFDEFEDTTVGLLCVAGGSFPTTTLDHLRAVSRALDAWVVPHQVAIPSAYRRFEAGEIVDEDVRDRVEVLGRRMVEYASIQPDPRTIESTQNVGANDR